MEQLLCAMDLSDHYPRLITVRNDGRADWVQDDGIKLWMMPPAEASHLMGPHK